MSGGVTLLIDTAFGVHIALIKNTQVITTQWSFEANAGDGLQKIISDTLSNHHYSYSDVKEILLGVGPGSFTGLRVGIAFAEGLSFAHKTPIRPFSTLQSMLWALDGKPGLALIPAKRGSYYCASNRNTLPGYKSEEIINEEALHLIEKKSNHITAPDNWPIQKHIKLDTLEFHPISTLYHYQNVVVNAKKNIFITNGMVNPNYVQAPSAKKKQVTL